MTRIKVLSWNIWGGKHLDKVIAQLQKIDADIIGLQEVKEIVTKDNRANIAQQIAQELGYQFYYCKAYTDDRHGGIFDFGNAILTKYPVISGECVSLSGMDLYTMDSISEPRAACICTIKIKGKTLKVINTHLGYSREINLTDIRRQQLDILLKFLEEEKTVLMGDFNSIPESEVVKELNEVMVNTDKNLDQKTKTDVDTPGQPRFRIDYIYVSKDLESSDAMVLTTEASDHNPIQVEIDL